MTDKDAIKWLRAIKDKYINGGDEDFDERRKEALDIAIKALEDRSQGKWKEAEEGAMTLEERVEQLETILMNLASRTDGLYVSIDGGNKIYSDTLLGYLLDNTDYKWKNLEKKGEKK